MRHKKKRAKLLALLTDCSPHQINAFYRVYAQHDSGDEQTIYQVVHQLDKKRLAWALTQVKNTVKENWQREQFSETQAGAGLETHRPGVVSPGLVLQTMYNTIDALFHKQYWDSWCQGEVVGGIESFSCEGQTFSVKWSGALSPSKHYDFRLVGNGIDLSGVRQL